MKKIMRTVILLALLGQMLIPSPQAAMVFRPEAAQEASKYAEKIRLFEEFVQKQMKADKVPGLSIAFMKDGFVWAKGYGYADLENKSPARPESSYRLASVTKPMTATAILQLVEKGKINLDGEVQEYVSYFPKKKYPVTVRQLLGHLGGISHYRNYDVEGHFKDHKNTRESIAVFEDFDLIAEPGTRYSYSSYGYNLLGAVIEGASGQSFGDYMRENVWKPAGMNDTRMDDPLDIIPNRVRGYQLINGEVRHSEFVDISSRFAAGGTRSTVLDLLKFAQGMNSGKLLAKASTDMMYTSMATADGRFTGYGMGWGTNPSNGHFMVGHGGSQQETRTLLMNWPGLNFTIAAAMNFENASPDPYAERLYELIMDEPWTIKAYTKDKTDNAILRAINDAFNFGLSYYDQHGKPLTTDPKELAEAFAYFNQSTSRTALGSDSDGAIQKLMAGRHPAAGQPFVKIGSFMASKLNSGADAGQMKRYYRQGAIVFFSDYLRWYRSNPERSADLRFSEAIEKQINQWDSDWNKTWGDSARGLTITPGSDLNALGGRLRKAFAAATVYPDYIDALVQTTQQLAIAGERERALTSANLAAELYPSSDVTLGTLAVVYVVFGERDKAPPLLQKAKEINARGFAGARNLNSLAYTLAGTGKAVAGMELLKIAVEMYPREANLYDSLGEFNLKKGDKQMAIEYYKKALELDPNLKSAIEMLNKIKQ